MNTLNLFTPIKGLFCAASTGLYLGLIASGGALAADLTSVDVELSLVVDGSSSISSTNFDLQRQAYANVFADPSLFEDVISQGDEAQIAVNFIQFSTSAVEEISWTLIDSPEASASFANQILGITQSGGLTNLGGAINLATDGLLNNSFNGEGALSIDISTDGEPTIGPDATTAANNALGSGVDVINALAIGLADISFLENNIIGGTNLSGDPAFVSQVDTFEEFELALTDKIFTEVSSVPIPRFLNLLLFPTQFRHPNQFPRLVSQ